ncbi:hypothetical protein [Microlunatus soli]|uniref:Uncharacterized protein n=1 Tax=Microlunatus soli TaxID=630515 RepID=A0A1H1Z8N4_9ACTN|nr:hypothetical protein [Microlunatus soli]SDT30013.1 hypothetical protein SAMN04489812_5056 [Microlunatus soli]
MSQLFPAVRPASLRRIVAVSAAASAVALTAGAVAPATASAASSVCGSVAHCTVVDHADVDGDGHADTVAVVPHKIDKRGNAGSATVRVKTSKGKLLTHTVKGLQMVPADHLLRASTAIDGEQGAELVITHKNGAHTVWYQVLTEKRGELRVSPAPRLPGRAHTVDWLTDGSVTTTGGIYRHKTAGKAPTVTVKTGVRDDDSSRLKGRSVAFRWQHGGWKKVSSSKHRWTPEQAAKISGWHVKGIDGDL